MCCRDPDASFRYERGADPRITIYALKRAANLIKEVAGGSISSEIIDVYPSEIENFEVDFSFENCAHIKDIKLDKTIRKCLLIFSQRVVLPAADPPATPTTIFCLT